MNEEEALNYNQMRVHRAQSESELGAVAKLAEHAEALVAKHTELWAQFHKLWGLAHDGKYQKPEWNKLQTMLKEYFDKIAELPTDPAADGIAKQLDDLHRIKEKFGLDQRFNHGTDHTPATSILVALQIQRLLPVITEMRDRLTKLTADYGPDNT